MEENNIGSKIRDIRIMLGLSQTEFAVKLGYSCSLISKIEAGQRRAPDRLIKLISSTFDTNLANPDDGMEHVRTTQELINFINDSDELNSIEKSFFNSYLRLTPQKRMAVCELLMSFVRDMT